MAGKIHNIIISHGADIGFAVEIFLVMWVSAREVFAACSHVAQCGMVGNTQGYALVECRSND